MALKSCRIMDLAHIWFWHSVENHLFFHTSRFQFCKVLPWSALKVIFIQLNNHTNSCVPFCTNSKIRWNNKSNKSFCRKFHIWLNTILAGSKKTEYQLWLLFLHLSFKVNTGLTVSLSTIRISTSLLMYTNQRITPFLVFTQRAIFPCPYIFMAQLLYTQWYSSYPIMAFCAYCIYLEYNCNIPSLRCIKYTFLCSVPHAHQ